MRCILCFMAFLVLVVPAANVEADERVITHEELLDKLSGFWIGQILGNYMGFPFENNYVEEPVPVFVEWINAIAKIAILENGGRMEMRDGEPIYIIECDF